MARCSTTAYHLFVQHDPYGLASNEMRCGHATVTATQISWYGRKNVELGSGDVYLDGAVTSGIDCDSTTREVQRWVFVTGLRQADTRSRSS
jgi:hypothetical protein